MMEKLLNRIRGRLKASISIEVRSAPEWNKEEGSWTVSLSTETNVYPYWLRWNGDSIMELLHRVERYLNGEEDQPHGREKVPGKAWLR